jgi:phosphate transport system substrate-binding protein
MTEVRTLSAGTIVGGAYRVVRPVAEGGMGIIYEVEQIATGAPRALKVMHGQFATDEKLRARFVLEARLAASIASDHIAQVMDAGQDPATGALYIVMELLDGTTLSRELRRTGPFPWSPAVAVLGQIGHALGAAHAAGIVHRDLKPANVFLSRSRQMGLPFMVKLLDFGIAKAVADASEQTAAILGTPAWMAPEQTTMDVPIGPQADVWSFGLMAFALLTGRHYFSSANAPSAPTAAIMREVVLDPLLPASDRARQLGVGDRLPAGFDDWFGRCVHRSPERRFPEGTSAFEALARLPAPPISGLSWTPVTPPARGESSPRSAPLSSITSLLEGQVTAVEAPDPGASVGRPAISQSPLAAGAATSPSLSGRRRVPLVGALGLGGAIVVGWMAWHAATRERPSAASMLPAPTSTATTSTIAIRLHGSNTIGEELAPALAEAFLQRRTAAKAIVRVRTAPDEVRVEARDGERTLEAIEVFAHGTATGFQDLASGSCDMAMASRRIHSDEAGKLASLGDLTSAASEHVVGLDGIAVIVNPSNPVSELTSAQIGDVFAGKVVRWAELGGRDEPIVVHARDDRSGTYDTFAHLVLAGRPLVDGARRHESSDELSDAVAADVHAVGFIGLPYVRSAKAIMVQEAGSAPLLPSPMTVSTEDYPLARRLYLYSPPGRSIAARDFVDFALSEDGQKIVQATGFVDLRPYCDANAALCSTCVREYRDSVRGACRLSMDFRFDRDDQLDTRAWRDLPRVASMMQRSDFAGRSLLLFGFSDEAASHSDNVALSQRRVGIVAAQLRARGLHVDLARGLGDEMQVADNATAGGRERNRRIELWLR